MTAVARRKALLSHALAASWMGKAKWQQAELPRLEARGYSVSPRELEAIVSLVWGGFFDGR